MEGEREKERDKSERKNEKKEIMRGKIRIIQLKNKSHVC